MAIKIIGRDGQERKQGDTSSWNRPSQPASSGSSSKPASPSQTNQQTPTYSTTYQQQNERLQQQIQAVKAERAPQNTITQQQSTKDRLITAAKQGYEAGQGKPYSLKELQAPKTPTKEMLTYSLAEKANALSSKIDAAQNNHLNRLPQGTAKDFVTGVTNIPEMAVSAAGNIPLGVESMIRNPSTISDSIALGTGVLAGATVQKAQTRPAELAGELVGPKIISKTIKPAGTIAGESTGLIRTKTFGSKVVPYKSTAQAVETVFEKDFTTGARAAPKEHTTVGGAIRIRDPGSINDVGVGAKGTFMTIGNKNLEPHGLYFTNKAIQSRVTGTGLKADVLKKVESVENSLPGNKRVFIQEVRNVKIPESLKSETYKSIETTGNFEKQYPEIVRLADEQSRALNEPIAIPSPKRAKGIPEPENEVFVVMTGEKAATVTGKSFAGFTKEGAIIFKLRYGNQPKPSGTLSNLAENIEYNYDVGLSRTGLYKKGHLNAMVEDMNRRQAELNGDALSYPKAYEFGKHGLSHVKNVEKNLNDLGVSQPDSKMLAEYHDIAKVGPLESGPIPHAEAAEIAIKTGKFSTPELVSLPQSKRNALAKDIGTHTNIKPLNLHNIPSGLHTILIDRPSLTGKALATADRIDLTRFGIEVDQSKLFFKPGETITQASTIGKRNIFSDTTAELLPIKKGTPLPAVKPKGLVTAEEIFSSTSYEVQGSKGIMPEINIPVSSSSSVPDPVRAYKNPLRSSKSVDFIGAYKGPLRSSTPVRAYEDPLRSSKSVDSIRAYKDPFESSNPKIYPPGYISDRGNILDYKPLPNKSNYTPIPPKSNNYTPPPPNPDTYTPPPPNPDTYTPPPPNPDTYTPPPPNPDTYTPPPPNPFSPNFKWDIDPFENKQKHKKTKKKMLENEYGDPFKIKFKF
ncbi:hypothetical protein [Methanosarcina sp. UBA289]|uniref:hypothetical protein n=1 Tax=Methanosarcina sp. UBA289 TaxID=1915574 RepID=UPI0025CB9568|nr:hypothetical protein [Methanosarcina sp. UBA289]